MLTHVNHHLWTLQLLLLLLYIQHIHSISTVCFLLSLILMHVDSASQLLLSAPAWQDSLSERIWWASRNGTDDRGWVDLKCAPRVLAGGSACLFSGLWQTWSPIPSKWVNPVRLVHTPVVCFEKHLSMDICPEDRSGAPSLSPISRTGWLHLGLTVARCAPDQTAALRRHFCRCFCHSWCNFLEFQHLADVGISSGEL